MKITKEIKKLGDRALELRDTKGYTPRDAIYAAMDERNIQDSATRRDRYPVVFGYLRLKKKTKAEAAKKQEARTAEMNRLQISLPF